MEEPAGLWGFDDELEGPVGECCEPDLEWDVTSHVACLLVELFAKLHHVDSEGTKSLTHLGVGLGYSSQHSEVDGCCMFNSVYLCRP